MYQTLVDTEVGGDKEVEGNSHKSVFSTFLINRGIKEIEANKFQSNYDELREEFYLNHDKKTEHHDFKKLLIQVFKQFYAIDIEDEVLGKQIWQYRILVRGNTRLYDGVKETLEILSKEHTIFLASYTQASYSLLELEELGIKDYFKGFIFSSDIGYRKMSNEFYKKCIEASKTEASNCIMIGDNGVEDVYMAKKNGMKAVWIKNLASAEVPDSYDIYRDAELDISDFVNLPEIVKSIQ